MFWLHCFHFLFAFVATANVFGEKLTNLILHSTCSTDIQYRCSDRRLNGSNVLYSRVNEVSPEKKEIETRIEDISRECRSDIVSCQMFERINNSISVTSDFIVKKPNKRWNGILIEVNDIYSFSECFCSSTKQRVVGNLLLLLIFHRKI